MFVTTPAKCHHKLQCVVIYAMLLSMLLSTLCYYLCCYLCYAASAEPVPQSTFISLRQLQEKCREQQVPLYTVYIDLTKAFDLVSRSGLFQLLDKIGCPPNLLSMITAFHSNMKSTVLYDGAVSNAFPINSGIKQGCVIAFRTSEY